MLEDNYTRNAEILRVIDGDTWVLLVDLGFTVRVEIPVRLAGIDTPEVRGIESRAGKFVVKCLHEFLGERTKCVLHSERFDRGKFGRSIGRIYIDGECINDWLVEQGFAWELDDNGRSASRDIGHLNLPPGIITAIQAGST